MNRYINNINTPTKNIDGTTAFNNYAQYLTDEDELSITSDISPNTHELETICQNYSMSPTNNTTAMEQPINAEHKQLNLMELLLRYDIKTPAPGINQTRNVLPILPPWPNTTEPLLKHQHTQPNSN
jgi:hypothetical protein